MPLPKVKTRGFAVAKGWEETEVILPSRSTTHAAGYDFYAPEDISIPPSGTTFGPSSVQFTKPFLVNTGIKAYMKSNEFLVLANRSSNPKLGLLLANGIGCVDCDYFSNETNDGHIMFAFWNLAPFAVEITKGQKIGQGIFMSYLTVDYDTTSKKRVGGFGSTGK